MKDFERPVISIEETGRNIKLLREAHSVSVKELQAVLGFEYPQTIYNWESGKNLPSIDNLLVLSAFFHTPMEKIVGVRYIKMAV
ncbi:MAG: helix-turn-helix transcriptional regulator [Spirochaetales bacterium]|nr:helix-turn-helix transcriptional regulator [Candidatus Physcosoma equi]